MSDQTKKEEKLTKDLAAILTRDAEGGLQALNERRRAISGLTEHLSQASAHTAEALASLEQESKGLTSDEELLSRYETKYSELLGHIDTTKRKMSLQHGLIADLGAQIDTYDARIAVTQSQMESSAQLKESVISSLDESRQAAYEKAKSAIDGDFDREKEQYVADFKVRIERLSAKLDKDRTEQAQKKESLEVARVSLDESNEMQQTLINNTVELKGQMAELRQQIRERAASVDKQVSDLLTRVEASSQSIRGYAMLTHGKGHKKHPKTLTPPGMENSSAPPQANELEVLSSPAKSDESPGTQSYSARQAPEGPRITTAVRPSFDAVVRAVKLSLLDSEAEAPAQYGGREVQTGVEQDKPSATKQSDQSTESAPKAQMAAEMQAPAPHSDSPVEEAPAIEVKEETSGLVGRLSLVLPKGDNWAMSTTGLLRAICSFKVSTKPGHVARQVGFAAGFEFLSGVFDTSVALSEVLTAVDYDPADTDMNTLTAERTDAAVQSAVDEFYNSFGDMVTTYNKRLDGVVYRLMRADRNDAETIKGLRRAFGEGVVSEERNLMVGYMLMNGLKKILPLAVAQEQFRRVFDLSSKERPDSADVDVIMRDKVNLLGVIAKTGNLLSILEGHADVYDKTNEGCLKAVGYLAGIKPLEQTTE
ncbi:MAG: hypothetical protein ACE5DM_01720 [Candidatus Nanoarchaeia archaeon]